MMQGSRASQAYQEVSDRADREQLILENVQFVRHVVRRTVGKLPPNVDIENLESAGMLGLVEATHRFDMGRENSFQTFAYPRVRGAILDELRRSSPLSRQMLRQVTIVRKAARQLDPPATPENIAAHTGLSVSDVEKTLEAMRLARPDELDPASDYHDLSQSREDSPDIAIQDEETRSIVADCIEELPEQERVVLTLYHLEDLRLREIGKVLGLSESRISRVLAKAEFRLGEAVKARGG